MRGGTRVQCVGLTLERCPQESAHTRLDRILEVMRSLDPGDPVGVDLTLYLAPQGYLHADQEPLEYQDFCHFFDYGLQQFRDPRFRSSMVVAGSLFYRDGSSLFHVALCFLGGTEIACQILQQTYSADQGVSQNYNATLCLPCDPRVLSGEPTQKIDFFRPETGLRLGIELGNDHFDGLLWSAFTDQEDNLPDMQLVLCNHSLTDSENRIYGNTGAVRSGGLLFGCSEQKASSRIPSVVQLFRFLGQGRYQAIQPTTVLTAAGVVHRYPSLVL